MEQQWAVEGVLAALTAIVLLVLFIAPKKSKANWPPGPKPWPVLGNFHLLGTLPHQSLAKLAKKYGPLMAVNLGQVKVLVASSPAVVETFLKTHDKIWASRHATTAAKIMCYDGMDIAFSEYGPRWRYAKKVFLLELFTAKRLSDFQKTRKEEIMRGINALVQGSCKGTKALQVDLTLRKLTMNVMTRMLMNQNVYSEKSTDRYAMKDSDDFQETIKEAFRLFGVFYLGDFVPWLDRFDPQGLKKQMKNCFNKYDSFIQSVLDDHKVKLERAKQNPESADDAPQDIVDTLLTRPRDVDGQQLTEVEMKALIEDVLLAGTDTNSSTIEWALAEMLKNPHILKRVQEEMDSVVGRDRLVEESDLPNLPYLDAIVKENFRLHPASALILPHVSIRDCELLGYKIPAKTRLIVNTYAIHRDPNVWDRALEFYPDRWLNSKKDVHGQDFDFLPFGSGRRICPGKGHGVLVVTYVMALALQTCNWSLPKNMKPEELDMDEIFGVTVPRKNALQAIVTPRLPEHVLRDYLN